MAMVRIIYVSRMTDECDMEGIQEILNVSRKKNATQQITGMLCYDPMFFLQCLEGPRHAVNELYGQILRDGRHTDVLLLEYADIEARSFGGWAMGFLRSADIDPRTLAPFTTGKKFDPYQLTGAQARDLLITVAAQERKRLDAAG